MTNILEEVFKGYEGKERVFPLNGRTLVVPARFDAFIHYRTKFRELAKVCSDNAVQEYIASVHDLDTYMDLFPQIYGKNLTKVIEKALNILVSEGIYHFSVETLIERHSAAYRSAIDDYQTMEESISLTKQNNSNINHGVVDGIGSLFGNKVNGFVKGFVKGFTEDIVDQSSNLSTAQKTELYQRLVLNLLFENIFVDYWNVVITLVEILKENGKDIWLGDSGEINDIGVIIQSINHPNFPQEKLLDMIFDCILKKPNEAAIYKILEDKFGLTEEVQAIFDYFIYPDFANPVYTEDNFPKQETENSTDNLNSEQDVPQQDTPNENQTNDQKKGLFSIADKLDKDKVKKGLAIGVGILAAGALMGAASRSGNNQEKLIQEQNKLIKEERESAKRAEYERKHQEAIDSQRAWDAVHKANIERRRKGQPELPYPPRKWY